MRTKKRYTMTLDPGIIEKAGRIGAYPNGRPNISRGVRMAVEAYRKPTSAAVPSVRPPPD